MPCPHFKITICKRSNGQSAVAGAAYQSGESLFSEYDQKKKAYTEKRGIAYTEIMLPQNAPPEYSNREKLWNSVEMNEKQWNAQLARRIVLALPKEIPRDEQIKLLQDYCKEQFVDNGMCVDFALHDKGDGNPHAHIMLTMRAIDENGKWLPKARKVYDLDENGERIRLPSGNWKSHKETTVDWNEQTKAEEWRHSWEVKTNQFLERNNCSERVDLRSYQRQGITDKLPTVHMGAAVFQMEKRGVQTIVGDLNRDIQKTNVMMNFIRKSISSIHDWIKRLTGEKESLSKRRTAQLTVPELLLEYIEIRKSRREEWNDYGKQNALVKDLQKVSQVIAFVEKKGIVTLESLNAELGKMKNSANSLRTEMRKKETRIITLSMILMCLDTMDRLVPVHDKYIWFNWKSRKDKYAAEHRAELDEYNKAVRYLKKQGIDSNFNFDSFRAEMKNLKSGRDTLQKELEEIKDEMQPLNDVRYYIGQVIPLDNEVMTTDNKKSISESIKEHSTEPKQTTLTQDEQRKKNKYELE